MNNKTWNELESFVRKEVGVFSNKMLKPETSLEDDLDITGDDADIFMEKFFSQFSVDIGDFEIDRYFLGEGGGLLSILATTILKNDKNSSKRVPLTLSMLEKAIIFKTWNTERIESAR